MDKEALAHAYKLFTADGYTGTPEQYAELIKSNKEALDYSYTLFSQDGYNGKPEDFANLLGVGNQIDPVKEVAVAGSEDQKQQKNTESKSETGSLDYQATRFKELKNRYRAGTAEIPEVKIDMQLSRKPEAFKELSSNDKQRLKQYRNLVSEVVNSRDMFQLGIEGQSIKELSKNLDFAGLVKEKVKEKIKLYPETNLNFGDFLTEELIDEEINNKISEENEKLNNEISERVKKAKEVGDYESILFEGFKKDVNEMSIDEALVASTVNLANDLRQKIKNTEDFTEKRKLESELKKVVLEADGYLDAISEKEYGKNGKFSFMYDPLTGKKLGAIEAEESDNAENWLDDINELKEEYKEFDSEALTQKYFYNVLEREELENDLNLTVTLSPFTENQNFNTALRNYALKNGLKAHHDGLYYEGVPYKFLLPWQNFDEVLTESQSKAAQYKKEKGKDFDSFSELVQNNQKEDAFNSADIRTDLGPTLRNIAKEQNSLIKEKEVLKSLYLLNIDPASIKQDAGDVGLRFLETVSEATIGDELTRTMGTTKRKKLDDIETQMLDYGITLTEAQKENFERSLGMKVVEGVGYFVPELAKFAIAKQVAGATGITSFIARISQKNKAAGLALEALLGEAEFKAVTAGESQTGGGAGFLIGSKLSAKFLPKFKRKLAAFNSVFEKTVGAGIGGVAGGETAKLAEAAYNELIGNKDFTRSLEELYGDMDEATEQIVVDGIVFGLLGAKGLKSKDFVSIKKRRTIADNIIRQISEGKFKGPDLEKKRKLLAEIEKDIFFADRDFVNSNIGKQKKAADEAKKVIADPSSSAKDKRLASKIVNKYESSVIAAEKTIKKDFNNFKKSGVVGENVKLVLTEQEGTKANYDPNTNTIKINISEYRPGVFAQEVGHAFFAAAFKQNPEVSRALKDKIVEEINTRLGKRFSFEGDSNLSFEEAIDLAYPKSKGGKDVRPEEFIMNAVEFLSRPEFRDLLLDSGVVNTLKRETSLIAEKLGLKKVKERNLNTAGDVLEFLFSINKAAEGGTSKAIKNKFEELKRIAIDGRKLIDIETGKEPFTDSKAEQEMASADINPTEKKDVFSKAEKVFEEYKENENHAGLMVGMEFEPIVRKMLRKYKDLFGMDAETFENIVSDVTIETRPGYNGVPALVKSWDPSKGSSLTSHIYGNLPKRILGIIQNKYPQLGRTVSLEAGKTEKLTNEDAFAGQGGFVDISSPKVYTRMAQKKAEKVLGLSEVYAEKASKVGERILMANKLLDLDAKAVGTVKAGEGKFEGQDVRVAMLEGNRARLYYPDGTQEVIKARSPKVVEIALGAPEKSFKKSPTTKDLMISDARDFLIPELEKEAGALKDNYTPTEKYTEFVDKSFPLYKSYISQSAVNRRFADFKEPVIDPKTGKQAREKTAAGNKIFTKKNISLAEWRKYFIGDGTKRIDGRRRSLLEAIATEQGFDKVMEALGNEATRKQIESRQEDINVDLIDNYVAIIAKSLDRNNPTVMASEFIDMVSKELELTNENTTASLIKAIAEGPDNIISRLPEFMRDTVAAFAEKEVARDLRAQRADVSEKITNNTKQKLNVPADTNFNKAKIKSISQQTPADLQNTISNYKKIARNLPPFVSKLTKGKATRSLNTLISSVFSFTSRSSKTSGFKFVRAESTAAEKRGFELLGFTEQIAPEIGKNFKENLSAELVSKWTQWSKGVEKGSLGFASEKFLTEVNKIADNKKLDEKQKQDAVDKLKNRKTAEKDQKHKEEFLNLLLETIGETSKDMQGTELNEFAYSVATMLLNNDGTGIRNFSSLKYIDLSSSQGKRANEHLQSKAEFAARVIESILEKKLSAEEVKELTSGYNSEISSKKGQGMTNFWLGATVENVPYLKMALEGSINGKITLASVRKLKNKYNWVEKKSAYDELINAKLKELTENIINSDKKLATQKSSIGNSITEFSTQVVASKAIELDNAIEKAKDPNKKVKGISVFDFDDTLAKTKSNVLYTIPGEFSSKSGKLNATEFAKKGAELELQGAEFDFSEFTKVIKAELGPLFEEAKKKAGKYTTKDIFVLTARPSESAKAIHEYLKSEGLNIPLKNIIGLGDGRAEAKAEWITKKVSEGYNDFYFADDAIKNVQAVKNALDVFDVKSDVQQAIMASKDIKLDLELGKMIERKKGISATTKVSEARAANLGRKKGKFEFYLPPNAEDFQGLLYKFYGKGEQGNADMELTKQYLLKPYGQGELAITTYKQNLANDFKAMEKQLRESKTKISAKSKKALEDLGFNADQAVRVSIWQGEGYEIPGVSNIEAAKLTRTVLTDPRLKAYAEGVKAIVKTQFPEPSKTWFSSNIKYDLYKHASEGTRKKFLKEFSENVDAMFTKENMNKIEAAYGRNYRENLEQMISRMKTGKARKEGTSKAVDAALDYINGSVGVIMWMNTRSAMLQTISAVNYINLTDNNPLAVAKTLANPRDFARNFKEIMNSDFLKQRREGLELNIEEAEIAKAVEQSRGKASHLFNTLIKAGFKPTQIADSFAIAAGGTPLYINRTKTYMKQGLTEAEAKKRAFEDLREITEENQQSSKMDRVSNIQTGMLGRIVFAFNNTPMQMARIQKKAALDLINRRGDWKTNVSKLVYYSFVQQVIFYALQQAAALTLFGEDDENLTEEQRAKIDEFQGKKGAQLANSVVDGFFSGSGLPGKLLVTGKNTLKSYIKESDKKYGAEYLNTLNEALSISPPLSSKTRKASAALKTFKYYSSKKGQADLESQNQLNPLAPVNMARAKMISATTNLPIDRVLQKTDHLVTAIGDDELDMHLRVALGLGWDKWSLGFYDDLYFNEKEDNKKSKKTKKQIKASKSKAMKEYWQKRKAAEKRERDSIINIKSKMTAKELLEYNRKQRKLKDKK